MNIYTLTATTASLALTLTAAACDPSMGIGDALVDDPTLAAPAQTPVTPAMQHELLPGEQFGDPDQAPELIVEDKGTPRAEDDEYIAEGYTAGDHKSSANRVTYRAYKWQRGSTVSISTSTIANLCGDLDGCTLRMGMYNWDGSGRVASRENLFFYNTVNRAWRAAAGDWQGSDYNGSTQHIMKSWSCYFTDGYYSGWTNHGDSGVGFGLLSWNQYNAECWLTIID
ncbi:MAG: hypothetical protein AAGC55_15390 [Myxococcota bacterium]